VSSDLIVFGEDWGGLPSSTQHLMAHIARDRKILWINSIGLRKPRLNATDARRALTKLLSRPAERRTEAADTAPNFTVINPKTLPAPSNGLERLLARKLLCHQLLPAIKAARLQRPILWISLPTAADLVGELGEIATVYYCGDDFSALAGVDHVTVAAREKELNQKADLVLAASEVLATRFPKAKTRLLTHGVDYKLFSTPRERAPDLPQYGKPIAGFYGSLSEWLDIELLVATIQRMPHWNFVFIGNPSVDVSSLASLENVYLLGSRPHTELPGYSQHWDASLLPFRDNAQIRACNPLKLSEYLAAGKPIVSTPFPALNPYLSLISTARSVDEMVAAIDSCHPSVIASNIAQLQRSAVAQQSWQARAKQVNGWLEAL
jgi:glycosyltransferase involved in cell wall biosynthesis